MKFPSKYSNGKEVTPAQYLAELICERLAKKKKKDLHYRFWLSPDWEKEYKGQITAANKLLSRFDIKYIIAALSTYHGQKIYSLRAPHLADIITRESNKPQPSVETVDVPKIQRNIQTYGRNNIKHSIVDKLKDIEDGNIT